MLHNRTVCSFSAIAQYVSRDSKPFKKINFKDECISVLLICCLKYVCGAASNNTWVEEK